MLIKSICLAIGFSLTGCLSITPNASLGTYSECLYDKSLQPCDHYMYVSTTILTLKPSNQRSHSYSQNQVSNNITHPKHR